MFSVRDKIACSQFVAALSNRYVKRILQLEGIVTLTEAVKRANAIKIINENSFSEKRTDNPGTESRDKKRKRENGGKEI